MCLLIASHARPSTDSVMQFTKALHALAMLPEGSEESKFGNDQVITLLYNTLPHPPATFIGTDFPAGAQTDPPPAVPAPEKASTDRRLPFTYRSADGSGNNVNLPSLGKAGTPYARSVQNKFPLNPHNLPDAGEVVDSLLIARDVSEP